jgi:phage terminase small subunit
MGARGRKSSAELTLVRPAEEVLVVKRVDAPQSLSDEAKYEWREVVNSLPADHFSRSVQCLLEAYCCHAVEARKIDGWIQNVEEKEDFLRNYDRLLAMRERETRAAAMLSVRLGLSSATNVTRVRTLAGGREPRKPWA